MIVRKKELERLTGKETTEREKRNIIRKINKRNNNIKNTILFILYLIFGIAALFYALNGYTFSI